MSYILSYILMLSLMVSTVRAAFAGLDL